MQHKSTLEAELALQQATLQQLETLLQQAQQQMAQAQATIQQTLPLKHRAEGIVQALTFALSPVEGTSPVTPDAVIRDSVTETA